MAAAKRVRETVPALPTPLAEVQEGLICPDCGSLWSAETSRRALGDPPCCLVCEDEPLSEVRYRMIDGEAVLLDPPPQPEIREPRPWVRWAILLATAAGLAALMAL